MSSSSRLAHFLICDSSVPPTAAWIALCCFPGSVPSLVAGSGSGLFLILMAVFSLKAWKTGNRGASTPYTVASAFMAAGLTAMMTKRYMASGALFPPGVFAVLSGIMLLFYIYNLAAGGNPLPKKAD